MRTNRRPAPFITCAAIVVAALAMAQCGSSSSPTGPSTPTPAVSAVSLTATSVAVGGTGQGSVTLTGVASAGGASIALTSSNPAVLTVQTPVVISAGSSSASFSVGAVAAGTATITATFDGNSRQSATLTVLATALSAISLSVPTVVGGSSAIGMAALTGPAPAGGAVVSLSSADPITVPASVTVPAGETSATFYVATRVVNGTIAGTITGSYGGASASATLSVTQPTIATANFGVSGPTESETCTLTNAGQTLGCTFNGSTSTAPGTIVAWDWSWGVASTFTQTTSGPVLTMPSIDCSLLPSPPLPAGVPWFTMIVTLKIHDDLGNVSAAAVNNGVRLLPQGSCGF